MPPARPEAPDAVGPMFPRDVARLLAMAEGRPLSIERVLATMDDRGYALALVFLAFPFVLPVPSLGMSAPIGFFLALGGLTLARGATPSLPGFLRRRQIAYPALRALAAAVERGRHLGAFVLRPRLPFALAGPARAALGLSLCGAALILALPIPLPLSNFLPALAILMLALGLLEGDGLWVIAGHAATLGLGAVLYVTWEAARLGVERVLAWVI
ncbi:MAG TPA: exopolysaccharide biosynthesis protein [Vicinamibacteria bacterium]|nr:exopolysaccharide biosynthesis protein [Vicinamibacteria bacterium]